MILVKQENEMNRIAEVKHWKHEDHIVEDNFIFSMLMKTNADHKGEKKNHNQQVSCKIITNKISINFFHSR